MSFRLDHVSLLVRDINVSTQYYVDVFGFPIVRTTGSPVTGQWLGIGGTDTLHLNQDDFGKTFLTKDTHFAMRVDDLDAFIERLNELNVTFYDWPGQPGTIGHHPSGFRQIYIQDPNGYWVEINDNGPA